MSDNPWCDKQFITLSGCKGNEPRPSGDKSQQYSNVKESLNSYIGQKQMDELRSRTMQIVEEDV